jgi:hypothetical protein
MSDKSGPQIYYTRNQIVEELDEEHWCPGALAEHAIDQQTKLC